MKKIKIGNRLVGDGESVYIIAEIGSNHDGSLKQAKKLVDLVKKTGADAAKFQTFSAPKILCKEGFESLGGKLSFQAGWKKSVFDTYKSAEFKREWHQEIADYCKKRGIDFLSTPYDKEAVDLLYNLNVPAFKIGSGDINFLSHIKYIARKGKPIILSTGASTLREIDEAVKTIRSAGNNNIILLQCVTNYPSPIEQANIMVMVALRNKFQLNAGYSDHTQGMTVPLGAVALGACVIEKHFTFDKRREGPDHPSSMDVPEFTNMVKEIRLMEKALGSGIKKPLPTERKTIILQKRCIYASKDIQKGTVITKDMLSVLRPDVGIKPKHLDSVVGKKAKVNIKRGSPITWDKI